MAEHCSSVSMQLACASWHLNAGDQAHRVSWWLCSKPAWCPAWNQRRWPGAWRGARGGRGWRAYWRVCARASQTRIGGTGGPNPDREHGRVKPGFGSRAGQIRSGRSATKRRRRKLVWLQPHSPESGVTAGAAVVITGLLATAVITVVETVVRIPEGRR